MPAKYTAWGLYDDASDPRLIVPKRNPALGWTINLGHRHGRTTLLAIGTVVAAAVVGSLFVR